MKKIILTLASVLLFNSISYAQTPINILYIHGSDQGTVQEFQDWIDRMHPAMKKNLSENDTFNENELKNAYIKDTPQMLYWANRTASGRKAVEEGLKISKKISGKIPHTIRTFVAYLLHDAVWLQKYQNLRPILDELNTTVVNNSKNGEQTLVVGYSAGTLITYQYMLNKAKFLKPESFIAIHKKELNATDADVAYIKKYANGSTCIDAMVDSEVAYITVNNGLMLNPDTNKRLQNIKKLKQITQTSCIPDNAVIGLINFGSPVIIFYSNVADKNSQLQYFTRKLERNIVETGMFYLTTSYNKDPIAVPINVPTFEDLQKTDKSIKNGGGFAYNTLVPGGKNVAAGHLKYWDNTDRYTKLLAKSYETGYKLFYGIK